MLSNPLQGQLRYKGLSDSEVQQKLLKDGFNELPSSKPKNFFTVSIEVIKEPMFLLLVACCLLYIILGDLQEALTLSVFVIIIIGITLFQTWKTEKALSALKDLSSPKTLVIRAGKELLITSRELVIGDIIILNEGDKVSADAVILHTDNLMVDESSLTGESVPVKKNSGDINSTHMRPGEEGSYLVYNGTLITQGQAFAQITATGIHTELGKIGKALESIEKDDSRFKKEVAKVVSRIVMIAAVLCIIIIGILSTREAFIQSLLTTLTFAIAMLPEEIPAVLTIFMALGAWRMAQKNVLARKASAIETLGSVTVLCTDKTGTLTENKMTLSEIYSSNKFYELGTKNLPEEFHSLIEFAILASKEESFDPMEKALIEAVSLNSIDTKHIHKDWKLIKEYPLSKELSAMSRAWNIPGEEGYSFYSKGSPEAIFNLCHLNTSDISSLNTAVENMAARGLRVLGVAKSKTSLPITPAAQHDIDFEFCGLLGFLDPIRPGIAEAVTNCYSAGIKVVMITGDHHVTAQSIAQKIGLKNPEQFITGVELDELSDEKLQKRISNISIFSRVIPEQKLRIVYALKKNQEIVAMTGDGVNDAPALKASDVGIAMGKAGTNVARESADLVLLDDNFSSIVLAMKAGRRIFDNLRKAMSYILAIHVPIAGLTLVPVIFSGLPVIFFPIHVAFLELIIDPTCSIVFESEPASHDVMTKAPRATTEPILSYRRTIISLIQGLVLLAFVLIVYFLSIRAGLSEGRVRSLSFGSLLLGNVFVVLANRSWRAKNIIEVLFENKASLVILSLVLLSYGLIFYIPILKQFFHFS